MKRTKNLIVMVLLFISTFLIQRQQYLQASNESFALYQSSSFTPSQAGSKILPVHSFDLSNLSKGVFLVASPNLIDPNFSKSVILLLQYGKGGSVGLIINKPTTVKLKKILPKIKGIQIRNKYIFIGGPVSINTLFFVVLNGKHSEKFIKIFDDVYLIPQFKDLIKTIPKKIIRKQLRVYIGYAGWAPGQLEYEIARGDWYIYPADTRSIFFKDPQDVWPELIKKSSAQLVKLITLPFNLLQNCHSRLYECGYNHSNLR